MLQQGSVPAMKLLTGPVFAIPRPSADDPVMAGYRRYNTPTMAPMINNLNSQSPAWRAAIEKLVPS